MIARSAGIRLFACFVLVCDLMILAGCGGEDNGVLVPVSGSVSYKGAPLKTGEIDFIPEEAGKRGAHGIIAEDGRFTLSSYGLEDGAHPGKYKVTIVSRAEDRPIPAKNKGKMMEEDMQGSGKLLIPSKYTTPMTSGLAADVIEGKSNEFNFTLTD